MKYNNEYVPPILTTDSVIMQLIDNELFVLLIERSNEPFMGMYALPGGYNASGETTRDAMGKILRTKAGVNVGSLKIVEQLYTFDTVARDPRGHAVSVVYMGLGKDIAPKISNITQKPQFFGINSLPKMAYDHDKIIKYALERLQSKITYTNAVFALLDPMFTLSQLQAAYEAIFGRLLDKRNFRKKFLKLGLIAETKEFHKDGAHRPARLFRFKSKSLEALSRSFD